MHTFIRYRGGAGSVRGAKRHRGSRDDALDDILDEDDFTMPAPEEPPFMPEKWSLFCDIMLKYDKILLNWCTSVNFFKNPK